jgi:polar amino acid transport system substrate-binding protein
LKPYRIGIVRGTHYTDEFEAASYLKTEGVNTYDGNIEKLIRNRIDLFPEKKDVVLSYVRKNYPDYTDKIDYIKKPLKKAEFYVGFSKKESNARELVNDFNRGLKLIKKDGTYKRIVESCIHE